ncbi:prolyl oligopeptidase family serine peptidase [Sphingobium sp. BHU LFT2]|nr:prolyl oligopeptidase family serine peptidase [Sphingobium sp. BHU LFT2]
MSSCCETPSSVATVTGPVFGRHLAEIGFPTLKAPNADFWRPYALSVNAARIDTPILMQLADSEYLYALETIHALEGEGKPVEAYIFPDERHIKWQPAHRLAIYERNLAWFERWLMPH